MTEAAKKSAVEVEKENSRLLRGNIGEQLAQLTSFFTSSEHNLLKCHGTYQQDDRDKRQDLMRQGKEKAFSFMVRTKLPGGKLTANQYLELDRFAETYANGTLRITTRQGIQFHGVLKGNLKPLMKKINQAMITTLGACGDVVRNVCSCPAPLPDRQKIEIERYARDISNRTLPQSNAYHELWLDGKKVDSSQEKEPLYGKTYLPRKFKIVIAYPGDNCVDIYAHDLGLAAMVNPEGDLTGFNLLVGGGMGSTHNVAETYPLLAKPLGYVSKEKIFEALEAIIKIQRDFGNRSNRKRARLKYLVEEKGIPWMAAEFKEYAGFVLEPVIPMDWSGTHDHVGWYKNGTGNFFCGLFVENGRIKDTAEIRLRSGIRKIIETFKPDVYLTLQQNILFDGIDEAQKSSVEKILEEHGILTDRKISNILRWSMACPAFPTCGLAITESERALPNVIRVLEKEISGLGLEKEEITLRMTGCPNGCARPYTSEIGIVGSGIGQYEILLGGNFEGTRLNQTLFDKIKQENLVSALKPILESFKNDRKSGERFGDFCFRIGTPRLKQMSIQ